MRASGGFKRQAAATSPEISIGVVWNCAAFQAFESRRYADASGDRTDPHQFAALENRRSVGRVDAVLAPLAGWRRTQLAAAGARLRQPVTSAGPGPRPHAQN